MQRPFPVAVPYRTTPAPRPLTGPALVVDDAWPAARARRRQRLRDDPDGVLVRDPDEHDDVGLRAAVEQALALLPPGAPVRRQGVADPLVLAREFGLACADDLVVLRRRGPGRATAELLAVAFPSGWPPRERAGADLPALHSPVADGARLRAASAALTEALLTKGPFRQHVWGLDPGGRLDRDPSAPDAAPHRDVPPERWWLRVERQTSLPLPALGRALFLIRPHLVPLTALTAAQRSTLHDAVASMSGEALAYKRLTGARDDLLRCCAGPGDGAAQRAGRPDGGGTGRATGSMDLISEELLQHTVELMVRVVEAAGALVIFVGAVLAFVRFVAAGLRSRGEPHRFVAVRLGLGRYLALGLEFQLASDVLRTAVAPTLREIGELAAVAAIRTALNYFLAREIKEEQEQLRAAREPGPSAAA